MSLLVLDKDTSGEVYHEERSTRYLHIFLLPSHSITKGKRRSICNFWHWLSLRYLVIRTNLSCDDCKKSHFFSFVGVQLAAGAAKECYECLIGGCADPFDPNAIGVKKSVSTDGWCYVRIYLVSDEYSHVVPSLVRKAQCNTRGRSLCFDTPVKTAVRRKVARKRQEEQHAPPVAATPICAMPPLALLHQCQSVLWPWWVRSSLPFVPINDTYALILWLSDFSIESINILYSPTIAMHRGCSLGAWLDVPRSNNNVRIRIHTRCSLFWKKGSCKQKMFVCPTNQWAAFQNERETPDFDAKLSGGRLSIVANRNLGSVLLKTLLVSQKPMKIEFSKK